MATLTMRSNTELRPAPHHFRRYGMEPQPLLYRKQPDGHFHFTPEEGAPDGR